MLVAEAKHEFAYLQAIPLFQSCPGDFRSVDPNAVAAQEVHDPNAARRPNQATVKLRNAGIHQTNFAAFGSAQKDQDSIDRASRRSQFTSLVNTSLHELQAHGGQV